MTPGGLGAVSGRDDFDRVLQPDTTRAFDCRPDAERHVVVLGNGPQEVSLLWSVLLRKVDHDASGKPPAWSQHNLGTDANGSPEPAILWEVPARYVDEQIRPEAHWVDRLPY
ncbi:hypothetical protein SAMN05444365_103525 [Micromonospora pattaloongensis]|uniref:Uncharacterized protein n=1 Tax=Micromonospora pattaloongensis TaxID=405436 RepID=A0A1H3MUT1_9ACTN|nr:hypothetical protein SAMN05444365_103525 [Micromonospora pattaloongensis]